MRQRLVVVVVVVDAVVFVVDDDKGIERPSDHLGDETLIPVFSPFPNFGSPLPLSPPFPVSFNSSNLPSPFMLPPT